MALISCIITNSIRFCPEWTLTLLLRNSFSDMIIDFKFVSKFMVCDLIEKSLSQQSDNLIPLSHIFNDKAAHIALKMLCCTFCVAHFLQKNLVSHIFCCIFHEDFVRHVSNTTCSSGLKEASEQFSDPAFLYSSIATDRWNTCVFCFDKTTFFTIRTQRWLLKLFMPAQSRFCCV